MYALSFEASFYLTSTTKRKTNFVPSTVLVKSQERRAMCYGDKIDMSGNKLRLRSFDMDACVVVGVSAIGTQVSEGRQMNLNSRKKKIYYSLNCNTLLNFSQSDKTVIALYT